MQPPSRLNRLNGKPLLRVKWVATPHACTCSSEASGEVRKVYFRPKPSLLLWDPSAPASVIGRLHWSHMAVACWMHRSKITISVRLKNPLLCVLRSLRVRCYHYFITYSYMYTVNDHNQIWTEDATVMCCTAHTNSLAKDFLNLSIFNTWR